MGEVLVDVWVPGKARPKGSLERQGQRLVESNPESKPWRRQMAGLFLADYISRGAGPNSARWGRPVSVTWRAFFAPPPLAALVAPVSASGPYATGDKDKLERNILDALQGASKGAPGVLCDDAQVIAAAGWVHWCDEDTPQGLHVVVTSPGDDEIRTATRRANYEMQGILARRGLLGVGTGYR